MKLDVFVTRNRPTWNRLELMVRQHADLRHISGDELAEMVRLYREACSDYAYARTHFPYDRVVHELGHVVGQSHKLLYGSRPFRMTSVWRFLAVDFPSLVRSTFRYTLTAAFAFLLAALFSFVASFGHPDLPRHVLGDAYVDVTVQNIDKSDPFAIYKGNDSPFMSSFIMTNNIKVTFVAFGMGLFLGIGTIYVMIHNGMILGVFFYLFGQHGLLIDAMLTVMMHGVIELACIFVAGGAGLLVGKAIVFPGNYTRSDSVRREGRRAVQLVLGLTPLLALAGIIEGFVTGLDLPLAFKSVFVVATGSGLIYYLGWSGRETQETTLDRPIRKSV